MDYESSYNGFSKKEDIKGMYPKWDRIGLLRHKTLNGI